MNEARHNPTAVRVLLSVFAEGLACADRSDLEDVLIALRVVSPIASLADLCEARLMMQENRWSDALQLLNQLEAQDSASPKVRVLRAWCLMQLGERSWRGCIDSALDSEDPLAVAAANAFLASAENT